MSEGAGSWLARSGILVDIEGRGGGGEPGMLGIVSQPPRAFLHAHAPLPSRGVHTILRPALFVLSQHG